jgi:hypothetical protein
VDFLSMVIQRFLVAALLKHEFRKPHFHAI